MSTLETTTSMPIEPLDDRGSAVRFETQCVVIPDLDYRSRRPRVVTKSYALPLWRKRSSSACSSASAPSDDASPQEHQSHLVLRVPLPTFSRQHHLAARSVDHTPLPPCLVHRAPSSGPACASAPSLARRSRKPSPSPSRADIVTVPLRPCCAACQSVTEAALVGGEAWPEHFSRAASRRRSTSVDGSPRTITVGGSAASASYSTLGVSISVDEIDKRRRSSDTGPSTSNLEALSDNAKAMGGCRVPLIHRHSASGSSISDVRPPPSPTGISPATPRIPEEEDDEDEDENELFPLPSPKRTPTTSPTPSPAGSLSSLMTAQGNQTCTISPTPSSCSTDSAGPHPSKRHFLAPPPCSSSSSLSLLKLSESTTNLDLAEDPPPSPSLLSALPTLSGRRPSSPHISFVPPTPTNTLSSTENSLPKTPQLPESVPASIAVPPSPGPSQLSASPKPSPTHLRFPWRSKRSVSADIAPSLPSPSGTPSCSPSVSPTLSTGSISKKSISISSSRHIIADVLRGVGAMGSSGIGPGL